MNELKFTNDQETEIKGLLAPFGGPFNGRDIQGEHFSPRTDFVLDWFQGDRPLLYQHGLDPRTGVSVVGRIKSVERADDGLWMQAQLNAHERYYEDIRALVKAGKLALSSGSMRHLVQVSKAGEILRWPLIEGSLTPTPANPLAEVAFEDVKRHYKSIDVELPDILALLEDSLADHAEHTAQLAAALTERTKDLHERRVKEGRVISSGNRKRLSTCLDSMRMAVDDLALLLDSTDPAKAEAKAMAVQQLRVRLLALQLRSMTN